MNGRWLWENFVNLLLPRRCPYCNKVVGFAKQCVCATQVWTVKRPQGLPVQEAGRNLYAMDSAYAVFRYELPIKTIIWHMKFDGVGEPIAHHAKLMAQEVMADANHVPFTCVMPVPATKREFYGRENLPLALARGIAAELQLPLRTDLIHKVRETQRQHHLKGKERRTNLANAFAPTAPHCAQGESVLLVDDVLTTGSTLNECARALGTAGAACCSGVCLALVEL